MSADDDARAPRSAVEFAARMGDALDDPEALPPEHLALVDAVRRLVADTVATDLTADDRAALAAQINGLADRLARRPRRPLILVGRHADGRLENLTQAGSGRLNPHAPPVRFDPMPPPPPTGTPPIPVEVTARVTLTAAHGGPPDTAHGGVVATLLDEVIGTASTIAGATGLTAGLDVRYRSATPLGEPLVITARFARVDGRKQYATGEVRHGDVVTAEAEAIFIAPT